MTFALIAVRPLQSLQRTILIAISTLALVWQSHSQELGCNDDSEGSAAFIWAQNWNETTNEYNFSVGGFPIRMADPTILKLKDSAGVTWFFVTGSSTGAQNANFPIFRSRDLVTWEQHGVVFDPNMRGQNTWDSNVLFITPPQGGRRKFKHLWSPHLYYDPNQGDGIIYLTFAAAEIRDNDLDDDDIMDDDLNEDGIHDMTDPDNDKQILSAEQVTTYVMWTEKSNFLAGSHWVTPTWRNWMPVTYNYLVNNTGTVTTDGGAAQHQYSGYSSIPTSGHTGESRRWNPSNPMPGKAVKKTKGWHWSGVGPRTWMTDAPLVFFDPQASCRAWITWTWAQRSGINEDQSNIDAFPLRPGPHSQNYNLTDALYQNPNYQFNTHPVRLFLSYNFNNSIGGIPNGRIGASSSDNSPIDNGWGVAEGSDLIHYNNRYYAFATRNRFFTPAYQVVYRRSALGEMHLHNLHLPNPPESQMESVLLASNWVQKHDGGRDNAVRTNYGHSQFFTAYGRPYIIFHKMIDTQTRERRIFIKELIFGTGSTGDIARIWETHPEKERNVNWFKAPVVVGSGPPVP